MAELKPYPAFTFKHTSFFVLIFLLLIVQGIKLGKTSPATCITCKIGIGLLRTYVFSGRHHEQKIADLAINLCKDLNHFSDRVCEGIINIYKDEVWYILRSILTPDEICGLLLGNSCGHVINPFHDWTVKPSDVPKPPVKPIPLPKPGQPVLKVLQITDTHLDPHYVEGSNADCKEPLCCRLDNGPPASPKSAAGKWGDYRHCDLPIRTLENALEHASANNKIDYILWNGDITSHDVWNSTVSENIYLLRVTTNLIKKYFPGIPVFTSIGNHEPVPVNNFPPSTPEVPKQFDQSWIYTAAAENWKEWLSDKELKTFKRGGFFSKRAAPGLRIISLNTNYCYTLNWWLLLNSTDPLDQLQWLIKELQDAEDNNEKVHIIGHIPPGDVDCLKVWSRNFYSIINRYENTVMGQFYGHTHIDQFEIFYDEENLRRPLNVAYIAPSVTTYCGVNPSYRIYTIDGNYNGATYSILDHESFFLNLTEANLYDEPKWRRVYSAKEDFAMTSLNPSKWNALVNQFEMDENLFQNYYRYRFMMSDSKKYPCDQQCKDHIICQMRSGRRWNDLSVCSINTKDRNVLCP